MGRVGSSGVIAIPRDLQAALLETVPVNVTSELEPAISLADARASGLAMCREGSYGVRTSAIPALASRSGFDHKEATRVTTILPPATDGDAAGWSGGGEMNSKAGGVLAGVVLLLVFATWAFLSIKGAVREKDFLRRTMRKIGGVTLFAAFIFVAGADLAFLHYVLTLPGAEGIKALTLVLNTLVMMALVAWLLPSPSVQRDGRRKTEQQRAEERWQQAERQQQRQAEQQREAERQRQRQRERVSKQSEENAWWTVLEVPPHASADEIRHAYRRKIQQCHPDRVVGLAPEFVELAERRTQTLNAAYEKATRARRSGMEAR
jgi:hypothetical protein